MTKQIKVSDETFQKLGKYGTWSDTMDSIISRLLEGVGVESPRDR